MIVYTVGTFDLLHVGHLALLKHFKTLGDVLAVGVASDEVVNLLTMYYGHNRLWAISYLAHSGASRASRDTDLHSKCSEIVWEARTQKYSERMADFQIAGTREGCDVGWVL